MPRSKIRIRNPEKHTIEVYTEDYLYIDKVRTLDIGKVSVANGVKELIKAHEYCQKNKIDYKGLKEE